MEPDGSQFMVACYQDYNTDGGQYSNNVPGIDPQTTTSLGDCIDLCDNQGTQCMGVTWQPATNYCYLKTTMQPTDNPGYVVNSAVRISGPTLSGAPSQLIVNGGFDGGTLSPWVSGTDEDGDSFSVNNGQAYKYFPLTADAANDGGWGFNQLDITLSQGIAATSGYAWFFSAYLNVSNNGANSETYCSVVFEADNNQLWSGNWYALSQEESVNASGILPSAASNFGVYAYCQVAYGTCS